VVNKVIANSSTITPQNLPALYNGNQIDYIKKELTIVSTGAECSKTTFDQNIARINNNFDGVNPVWVKEIFLIVKEQKLTDKEFTDLVTTVMRSTTFTGKPPAIALFKVEKPVIPLFTGSERDLLVHRGQASFSDFGIFSKEPGRPVMFAKRSDLVKHNLPEIPPTTLY